MSLCTHCQEADRPATACKNCDAIKNADVDRGYADVLRNYRDRIAKEKNPQFAELLVAMSRASFLLRQHALNLEHVANSPNR